MTNYYKFLQSISAALLLAFAVSTTYAQDAEKAVWVQGGRISYNLVRQGSEFRVAVVFNVNSFDLYINSHQPADPTLVPTRLELVNLENLNGFTFSPFAYPKEKKKQFKFSTQPLSVYDPGVKQIRFRGYAAADTPRGRYELKAKLTYQACNDSGCGHR